MQLLILLISLHLSTGNILNNNNNYEVYRNPYNVYYRPYSPWYSQRYPPPSASQSLNEDNPWQAEDPLRREVYDALKREIDLPQIQEYEKFLHNQKLLQHANTDQQSHEFGLHSIPGLSSSMFYQDETPDPTSGLPVDDENSMDNYSTWESGNYGEYRSRDNSLQHQQNYDGPIWNEQGQYWGYPSVKDQPNDAGGLDMSNKQQQQQQQIFTAFSENDKNCVPPFCIPIQCNNGEEAEASGGCSKRQGCSKSNCNKKCLNGGVCNDNSCCCKSSYMGASCEVMKPDFCLAYYRLSCQIGCVNERESLCVCNPWKPEEKENCKHVDLEIFACPQGCNGRGSCNTQTNECKCHKGFSGYACDKEDFCGLLEPKCSHTCVNEDDRAVCQCPAGYALSADLRTCGQIREVDNSSIELGYSNQRHEYCRRNCINGFCNHDNKCICRAGYEGEFCELDIDECRQTDLCNSQLKVCVNTRGSFECRCKSGLRGADCTEDIDECKEGTHACQHICVNTFSSYSCQCYKGYFIDSEDRRTCQRSTCPADCNKGSCDPNLGKCICYPGYEGDDCSRDIDECSIDGGHACGEKCINTEGSYKCGCFEDNSIIDVNNPSGQCIRRQCPEACVNGRCNLELGSCQCQHGFTGVRCDQDIDECAIGQHDCEQICVNDYGSFACHCHPGYLVDQYNRNKCVRKSCPLQCKHGVCNVDQQVCKCALGYTGDDCSQDIDECSAKRRVCEQRCINTFGSYRCECDLGYSVDMRDRTRCNRVQPTGHSIISTTPYPIDNYQFSSSSNNNGIIACNPRCIHGECYRGQFCKCFPGYFGRDCGQTYDVCAQKNPCEQICESLGGGQYTCKCYPGYEPYLPGDSRRCRPLCRPGIDCVHGECNVLYLNAVNITKKCNCNPGWSGNDCDIDVDECREGSHKCQQICINNQGSYACSCEDNYRLQPDGYTCMHRDQVQDGCNGGCLNGGTCLDGDRCLCLQGFKGPRCSDRIDFCRELNPCQHHCYNNAGGGYRCSCKSGYELNDDRRTCSIAKECEGECLNNGRCYQGRCLCAPGFQGQYCERDVDECQMSPSIHKCQNQCINTVGSYECICPEGHFRLADRKTCVRSLPDYTCEPSCKNGGKCQNGNVCECRPGFEGRDCSADVNECERNHPCAPNTSRCKNLYGGYQCICNQGYVLMQDSVNCMTHEEAKLHPDLVHRGKSQKGIVLGRRLECPDCVEETGGEAKRFRRRKRRSRMMN